ncbi:hypothetical protein NQ317_015554 [Molorchus minor]|uniref:Uncharacterized protein n=1 Tax=Molorchus minor TaxID=1323400 RepID=A0ABQ9ITY8_9CUCU|nr:hypothetical protein NQ317_015554 [Molorchus minor]
MRARTCDNIFNCITYNYLQMLVMLFIVTFAIRSVDKVQIIYIDIWKEAPYKTSPKFLSITLDSSVIADGFHNFNMSICTLQYLRVGGTLADIGCIFHSDLDDRYKHVQLDSKKVAPNFNMTGVQWLNLMKLVKKSDLTFSLILMLL